MLKTLQSNRLQNYFLDQREFAWQLLENEIRLETYVHIDNKHIRELLQLYMTAIERLNYNKDPRESYFRDKMAKLMMKPKVIKCFNIFPKEKKQTQKESTQNVKPKVQQKEQCVHDTPEERMLYNTLQHKKIDMEMHMTYQTEQLRSKDALSKMIAKYNTQVDQLNKRINDVQNLNMYKQQERIKQRKLKSGSVLSKSTVTHDDNLKITVENMGVIHEEDQHLPNKLTIQRKLTGIRRRKSLQPYRSSTQQTGLENKTAKGPKRRSTIMEIRYKVKLD